jgi:hypothetical protein
MRRATRTIFIACCPTLLLAGLTACIQWPDRSTSSRHPDEILWTRAVSAFEHQRCDVGRLTLQTLINTYPDSPYADDAGRLLHDPPVGGCSARPEFWMEGDSITKQ